MIWIQPLMSVVTFSTRPDAFSNLSLHKADAIAPVCPTSDPPKPTKGWCAQMHSQACPCAKMPKSAPLQIQSRLVYFVMPKYIQSWYLVLQVTRSEVTKRWVLGRVAWIAIYKYIYICYPFKKRLALDATIQTLILLRAGTTEALKNLFNRQNISSFWNIQFKISLIF